MLSVAGAVWLADVACGVTLVLAAGWAVMRLCRQPAARRAAGVSALLACVVVAVAAGLPWLPRWRWHGEALARQVFDLGVLPGDRAAQAIDARGAGGGPKAAAAMAPAAPRRAGWLTIIGVIYSAAAALMALRLALGLMLAARLVRRAEPAPENVRRLWRRMGGPARARVAVSRLLPRPVTVGVWRETVLLPAALADEGRAEALEAVLLHELAHVRQRDTAVLLLASVLRVFLFVHPLYWLVWRDVRLNQEVLADAWAARCIGSAATYAERLLTVARHVPPVGAWVLPALQAIRRRSEFHVRMERLLTGQRPVEARPSRAAVMAIGAVMLLCAASAAVATVGGDGRVATLTTMAAWRGPASTAEKRGLEYLLARQEPSGGWLTRTGPGVTALAVRALVQGGYAMDSPPVKRALAAIEALHQPDGGYYIDAYPTYNTAIVVSVLANLPGNPLHDEVARGRAFLRSVQQPAPQRNAFYAPRGERPALSLGRLAEADALSDALPRSAMTGATGGLDIRAPFERQDQAPVTADGTLTYVQLKSLLYAGLTRDDPRVQALVAAVRRDYSLQSNALYHTPHGQFYFYYVLSKALRAYGRETVTDAHGNAHNWRAELVAQLRRRQAADGSWVNRQSDYWLEDDPVLVTTYGVLTLQEAAR